MITVQVNSRNLTGLKKVRYCQKESEISNESESNPQ